MSLPFSGRRLESDYVNCGGERSVKSGRQKLKDGKSQGKSASSAAGFSDDTVGCWKVRWCTYASIVALLTFAVYLPTLRNDFVSLDDYGYVVDNLHIRNLGTTFFKWALTDLSAGFWHPVTWISYAVDYAIWGLNPLGYHLTAIFLHAFNTFLVFRLVIGLLGAARQNLSLIHI